MSYTFFISRELSGPYKFLIASSKFHIERKLKIKLLFEKFKRKKLFNLKCFFFIVGNIINLSFFSTKRIMLIKYENFDVSRYAISRVFFNYYSYLNPLVYFFECLKNFYLCALTIESLMSIKKKNIKAAFVDHGMYTNGLMIEFFTQNKIPIYSIGYPRGLFCAVTKKNKKIKYEELIELKKSNSLNRKKITKAEKSIDKIISKTELIPWMKSVDFKKFNHYSIKKVTHIIYAHAFTDAQLVHGYDGFRNVFEWLEFTINYLLKNKRNKILIKAHPIFFHNKFPNKNNIFDQKLFDKLYNKYKDNKQVIIFKHAIKNGDLLKRIDKKTILISHHGSAILEGLHLGFKCIASTKTFWNKNFKLTNQWENIEEYKTKLNKKWNNLNFCKKKDLYDVCFQLFCNESGLYGKKFWQEIISKELEIDRKVLYENVIKIFKNLDLEKKKFKRITQKISNTILTSELN